MKAINISHSYRNRFFKRPKEKIQMMRLHHIGGFIMQKKSSVFLVGLKTKYF